MRRVPLANSKCKTPRVRTMVCTKGMAFAVDGRADRQSASVVQVFGKQGVFGKPQGEVALGEELRF